MPAKKDWSKSEEKKLIANYAEKTIQELMLMFKRRSQESINNKIKRLKIAGKIIVKKESDAIQRAYDQRKGISAFPIIEE
jgi:hypothetical protein